MWKMSQKQGKKLDLDFILGEQCNSHLTVGNYSSLKVILFAILLLDNEAFHRITDQGCTLLKQRTLHC